MKKLFIIILFTWMTTVVFAQWPYDNKPMMGTFLNHAHPLGRPVGFWYMPEGSGNIVQDLSGNGNTGTFGAGAASPSWVSGKHGPATNYDGGDYIDVGVNGFSVTDMTVVALVKPTGGYSGGADEYIFETGSAGADRIILYFNDDGKIRFLRSSTIGGTDFAYSSQTNFAEQYYHIVGTHSASAVSLYIDGIAQVSDSGGQMGSYVAARIGDVYGGGTQHFVGIIEYLYVYNRVLSAGEVALLYQESFCMFAEEDVALMAEGAAPAPTGGQVIMITSLPMLFFGLYLCRKYKAEVL